MSETRDKILKKLEKAQGQASKLEATAKKIDVLFGELLKETDTEDSLTKMTLEDHPEVERVLDLAAWLMNILDQIEDTNIQLHDIQNSLE